MLSGSPLPRGPVPLNKKNPKNPRERDPCKRGQGAQVPEVDGTYQETKRRLTWTVYTTPLMTVTTHLGLSIRVSMFELRETGGTSSQVPWNGQGRRLVELKEGCYGEGNHQVPRDCHCLATPVSLGYPLSFFNKNSTLKAYMYTYAQIKEYTYTCILMTVYVHASIYTSKFTYTHKYVHIYVNIYIYQCMYIFIYHHDSQACTYIYP